MHGFAASDDIKINKCNNYEGVGPTNCERKEAYTRCRMYLFRKQILLNLANNDIKIDKCINYEASKKYHKKDA